MDENNFDLLNEIMSRLSEIKQHTFSVYERGAFTEPQNKVKLTKDNENKIYIEDCGYLGHLDILNAIKINNIDGYENSEIALHKQYFLEYDIYEILASYDRRLFFNEMESELKIYRIYIPKNEEIIKNNFNYFLRKHWNAKAYLKWIDKNEIVDVPYFEESYILLRCQKYREL